MNCPVCGKETGVVNVAKEKDATYRKRMCKGCGYAFYTTESEQDHSKAEFKYLRNQQYKALRIKRERDLV